MVATKRFTVADLEATLAGNGPYELIDGELHEVAPVGGRHGEITIEFSSRLAIFARATGAGRVYSSDTRFVLARDPDVVVRPDVAFVRTDRIPPEAERIASMPLPPDLVVEVISTHDTRAEVTRKIGLYLAANVPLILVLDQKPRTLMVHRPGQAPRRLGENDTFDGGDILPGFRLAVADVFR